MTFIDRWVVRNHRLALRVAPSSRCGTCYPPSNPNIRGWVTPWTTVTE